MGSLSNRQLLGGSGEGFGPAAATSPNDSSPEIGVGYTTGQGSLTVRRPQIGREESPRLQTTEEDGARQGAATQPRIIPDTGNTNPDSGQAPGTEGHNGQPDEGNNSETRTSEPPGTDPTPGQRNKDLRKRDGAKIKVASLNMKGKGPTPLPKMGHEGKWFHINQLMRDKNIGALAIQEAHMTQIYADSINSCFGKRIKLFYSQGENPRANGVVLVLNKDIISPAGLKELEIIPGRAMIITLPWHGNVNLTILNVYAPAESMAANEKFWKDLKTTYEEHDWPAPDILLGDFNLVEDSIDRLPNRIDNNSAVHALRAFRRMLKLHDGWRLENENEKAYSFLHGGNKSQARLDRIYVSDEVWQTSLTWSIDTTAIESDHKMVSVEVTHPDNPEMGRGRWQQKEHLLKDKELMDKIISKGIELTNRMNNLTVRTDSHNFQIFFEKWKDEVIAISRKRDKVLVPRMEAKIRELKEDVKRH